MFCIWLHTPTDIQGISDSTPFLQSFAERVHARILVAVGVPIKKRSVEHYLRLIGQIFATVGDDNPWESSTFPWDYSLCPMRSKTLLLPKYVPFQSLSSKTYMSPTKTVPRFKRPSDTLPGLIYSSSSRKENIGREEPIQLTTLSTSRASSYFSGGKLSMRPPPVRKHAHKPNFQYPLYDIEEQGQGRISWAR